MQFLEGMKNYLSDRPETAFLVLCICVIIFLYKDKKKTDRELVDTLKTILPLQTELVRLIEKLKGLKP